MRIILTPLLVLIICSTCIASGKLIIAPPPPGEPASADYQVYVEGKPVFCYTSYRFDTDSKQTIIGRPVSPVSFCTFDHEGPVDVEVRFLGGLAKAGVNATRVTVRPLARNIRPEVRDGRIRFRIDRPGALSIEPGGGTKHPLHIFANPLETDVPDPRDPNVVYFGPGVHDVDGIDVKSGQTVYIAAGAVVNLRPRPEPDPTTKHQLYGLDLHSLTPLLTSKWQKDITIRGRGILCARKALERSQRGGLAEFTGIENLKVEGIILRESAAWSLNIVNSNNVRVSNVKIIAHYVNSDGICIGGTSNALVQDCFCHNADDSLEVKVWIPQHNVTFRHCTVWSDLGGSLGLMHEAHAQLRDVLYEHCTVIHSTDDISACPVIGLKLTGSGNVSGVRFENITIEDAASKRRPTVKVINNWDDWHLNYPTKPGSPYELLTPPTREKPSGSISDVAFRNISILGCRNRDIAIISDGPASPIRGVSFDNVTIAGRRLLPSDPRIRRSQWISDVTVR